jgi:hypothetical protein
MVTRQTKVPHPNALVSYCPYPNMHLPALCLPALMVLNNTEGGARVDQ